MAPVKALIVIINGIECYRDLPGASNESEAVNRKSAIQERFPDAEVMELNVFPGPEVRLKFPADDWISQSAVQALADLETASRDSACDSIVFIANNIGVALAKQILLLAFDPGNTHELAHRTLTMFFADYPDFNEPLHRIHHEELTLRLLLDYRQRLFSETFIELLNTLPRVLYVVDNDFAVIETKYYPTYLPSLPLSFGSPSPILEEAFFTIDDVIGRKHTQLLLKYESFLKRGTRMASELRRPAPLRENIESMAWVLDHSTFQEWQQAGSSPILFISGPPGSGKTILSWSIPSLLDTENRKRASDQRELYLLFDFSCYDTRSDTEQNFVTSLIYQCLTLRPQLYNNATVMCQLILDLRSGSVSSLQLWSLLRQLLSSSDDHRVFLIVVAIDKAKRADTRELDIFKRLLRLANDRIMSGRLRILVTGRVTVNKDSHESLHIDLEGSKESRAATRRALFDKVSKIVSMRPVWNDYVEEIIKNSCFSNSNYFDTMLRAVLLESTKTPSTRASLIQNLKYMESIGSTDRVYQLLLSNLENFKMAKEALNWVFHATRPLTVSELSVAIALSSICNGGEVSELEPLAGGDATKLLEENISWDLRRDLQGMIGKTIKVVGSVGNVCLIHDTFRQHFVNCKDLFVPGFHSLITQRCLAYISAVAKHVSSSSVNARKSSRALALLGYADLNWTEHYKLSVHPNSILDQTATAFLLRDEGAWWFERLEINAEKILDADNGDPLVMAAERGLTNVVKGLKTDFSPPRIKGWNSEVALQAAIWRDRPDIFEIIFPMVLPFPEPTFPRRCLKLASEYGHTEYANVILSKMGEGDIDALVKAEDSPCLVAAKNGHMETLIALLERLPEEAILQTDSSSRTVIHWAAAWGDADALRKLNKIKGVRSKILSTDSKNSTLLHLAAAAGSVEAVEFLLEVAKELVEKKDGDNLTALHLAAKEGHKVVVNTLIKARVNLWARSGDDKDPKCALELVAAAGHLSIFSLLVDQMKKSLEEENKQEGDETKSDDKSDGSHLNGSAKLKGHFQTSLNEAIRAGHSHIVRYILSQGSEYVPTLSSKFVTNNFFNSHGLDTIKVFVTQGVDLLQEGLSVLLLGSAVQNKRADIVRYIVNAIAERPIRSPYICFPNGGNILHYAARKCHRVVMRELLGHYQANLLLQESNDSDDKPLDIAVMEGNEAVIKDILRVVQGRRNLKTIFRAIEAKRVSIVKLLLANGWAASCRDGDANTPLHKATEFGQAEVIKLLLEKSTSLLNEKNGAGDTSLHIAVSKKYGEIVKRLLDSGADPNVRNPTSGLSPLHFLCKSGGENAEEILKEFTSTEDGASKTEGKHREKTDFSLPAADGSTALHYAINLKDVGLIRIILQQEPNLNAEVTKSRTTPLMAAITEGVDIEVIKLLLKPESKANLDKRDSNNKSALDTAIDREEWPIAKELVEAGAEVNPKDIGDHPTPLYALISKKNLPMVEFLLSKGADPNLSGKKSLPPFELALFQESKDIAKVILESENFDLKTNSARYSFGSHLNAALFMNQLEIFDILVAKGANTEGSAPHYGKAIHVAMSVDYSLDECQYFVEKLIQIGAQVNDKDPCGRTPLSLSATMYPDSDITFLLNLKADPNLPDRLGATSLHYAAQISSNDYLKRLIENGGDVKRTDECNRSVLYRAAMSGSHDKFMTVMEKLPEDCRKEHLAAAIYPAAARRAGKIVETILKEITIDFNARDRNGWTVLEIAEANGDHQMISILREKAREPIKAELRGKIEPSVWNSKDTGPIIQLFGNGVGGSIEEIIEELDKSGSTNLRANACMFPDPETGVFYFEVTVLQAGPLLTSLDIVASFVSIGFCEEYAMLDQATGLFEGSWGFNPSDGRAYCGNMSSWEKCGSGYGGTGEKKDVVGCGVDFRKKAAFFTLNGENNGDVFNNVCGQLYPTVSLVYGTQESRVQVNFGKEPFRYNVKDRKADISD